MYIQVVQFRGKNILEQLSRTRFLRFLKIPPFSSLLRSSGEKGANFKSCKNRVLESYSNIFFTLITESVGKSVLTL